MCGISGYFFESLDGTADELSAMTRLLAHRGPDAEGIFQEGKVGLGHRRLSILDLSEAANQPMFSHDRRYAMVYNGEVYNFREIAAELGLELRTTSDSEVLLEAFCKLGPAFVERLNGMFAIALYDRQEEVLYLFRDRLGIKPLYYYFDGKNLLFASELKAIAKSPFLKGKLKVDREAVKAFLYQGYIPHPKSIYQQVYKLPGGMQLVYDGNTLNTGSYWDLYGQIQPTVLRDEAEAKRQLKELLFSSVQYRLVSDVELGTFLSGGIDSSLVTAVAQQIAGKKVKTFSIGFKDARFNESEYARKVAGHLGTEHYDFMLSEEGALERFSQLLDIYDEPFADASAIPTLLVSEVARRYVKVALGGDGGDELFHGYGHYKWAARMQNPWFKAIKAPARQMLKAVPASRYQRVAELLKPHVPHRYKSHLYSQEAYAFSAEELRQLLPWDRSEDFFFSEEIDSVRKLTHREAQAIFDYKYLLPDDFLVKVDRASMHHALEARVPLLDHRIVTFALNLHPELKYRNGVSKYLLKELLFEFVPKEMFDRPKQGFSIPLEKWLREDLSFLIDQYLSKEVVEQFGLLDYERVKHYKMCFRNNSGRKAYYYRRLWLLVLLNKWLVENA